MLAPCIAQQQGTTTHRRCLTINGLEVYAYAPIDFWKIEEAAYGQVSNFEFTIEDPGSTIAVNAGDCVVLWDTTLDVPEFQGYVSSITITEMAPGRRLAIRVAGPEALLDWGYVPQTTFAAGMALADAIQVAAALTLWPAWCPLRSFAAGATSSTQATPIGVSNVINSAVTTSGTLRSVISSLFNSADPQAVGGTLSVSVDMTWGLRVIWGNYLGTWFSDLPTTFAAYAGSLTMPTVEGLTDQFDISGSSFGVYVDAATNAGFVAARPVMGPSVYFGGTAGGAISDGATRAIIAQAAHAEVRRTSFSIADYGPDITIRPGARMTFTWPAGPLPSPATMTIGTVSKTFNPSGRVNYTVTAGAPDMSYVYAKGRP